MGENEETTMTSSKQTMLDDKVEEITSRCQPLLDYYEGVQEAADNDLNFKLYCTRMLWRMIPEKLLFPALDKWMNALDNTIDPLDIFLLGWHTGEKIQDLKTELRASIKGRLHRTGIRTANSDVDPRFRKVYKEYQSNSNNKTLNQLLQREFGIGSINKPNAELGPLRARFYRAKGVLDREKYQENLPEDDNAFESAYLDYLLRHILINEYDNCTPVIWRMFQSSWRTLFAKFIHENADSELSKESFLKSWERYQKKKQKASKRQRKDSDKS